MRVLSVVLVVCDRVARGQRVTSQVIHRARHSRRLEITWVTPRIVGSWLRQREDAADCCGQCLA
jgi:hypothetical protein